MKRLFFRQSMRKWGARCDCFDAVCMDSPAIIRLCCYIVYFNHCSNHNHVGVATWRAGGLQPPVKDRETLIEQSVTRINEARKIIVKQVVYDKFMKQISITLTLQVRQTTESR